MKLSKASAAFQKLTLESADRKGEPYTESDERTLSRPDMTILEKALVMRRTYLATGMALSARGIKSYRSLGDPERDQWLIENPNSARVEEITESLKMPELVSAGRPAFAWDD